MTNQITLRRAQSAEDIARFWRESDTTLLRDIAPHCDLDGPMTEEECNALLSQAYHDRIDQFCLRSINPGRRVFFLLDGVEVGFALYCIYSTEDSKCLIREFCVYPPYRCRGIGKLCFAALAQQARQEGARYFELNTYCHRARRFWESLGFLYNGYDEGDSILFCLLPKRRVPLSVSLLTAPDAPDLDWQLRRLENSLHRERSGAGISDKDAERIHSAIQAGRTVFFLLRWEGRAVGMCSVSRCFSTFSYSDVGVLGDLFIEPLFRHLGGARLLIEAAAGWCRDHGLSSLAVRCLPDEKERYRSLGFTSEPDIMTTHIL